ncbi:hypothetical protein EXU85_22655 [Spirosoma sp. KCTC 42546]|nr:hypothetical protein EXU85_22655 [Spirosoma sp. KCTC 42546]
MESSQDGQTCPSKSPSPPKRKSKSKNQLLIELRQLRKAHRMMHSSMISEFRRAEQLKLKLLQCQIDLHESKKRTDDTYKIAISASYELLDLTKKHITLFRITEDYAQNLGYPPLIRELTKCIPNMMHLARMSTSQN